MVKNIKRYKKNLLTQSNLNAAYANSGSGG